MVHRGRGISGLRGRHRHHWAWPRQPHPGRGDQEPGREAVARVQHLPHPRPGRTGQAADRRHLRRRGVLHQLRHRGDRVRPEDGAQVSLGQRSARAHRHHRLRRRLPRTQLRRCLRRRQPVLRRGLRPAAARLCQPAIRRHGRAEGRHGTHHRGGDHRAGAGGGRRPLAAGGRPDRAARDVHRQRRPVDLRRDPVRPWPHRQAVRL